MTLAPMLLNSPLTGLAAMSVNVPAVSGEPAQRSLEHRVRDADARLRVTWMLAR